MTVPTVAWLLRLSLFPLFPLNAEGAHRWKQIRDELATQGVTRYINKVIAQAQAPDSAQGTLPGLESLPLLVSSQGAAVLSQQLIEPGRRYTAPQANETVRPAIRSLLRRRSGTTVVESERAGAEGRERLLAPTPAGQTSEDLISVPIAGKDLRTMAAMMSVTPYRKSGTHRDAIHGSSFRT